MEDISWRQPGDLEPGNPLDKRELTVLDTVNWDRLLSISSNLRDGVPCTISERYSKGQFNMVRRIEFTDGTKWIARVRMPSPENHPRGRELLEDKEVFKIEIASMKFLKEKTSIPVPEVHHYNADPMNDVRAPYILMDYIRGSTADKLSLELKCGADVYGTPGQDRRFKEQMAEIQVTLSRFKFDRIGSLYYDEETSEFFIGADIETGQGPWKTSMEYYNDLADHRLHVCKINAMPEVTEDPSFENPELFKRLISLYGDSKSNHGPFGLVNRDFGAHNLLVDDKFNIIGVIDFDGIMAAPIEVVAQYPVLTGLERHPPGYTGSNPYAFARIKEIGPKRKQYAEMLKASESRMVRGRNDTPIADALMSNGVDVYYGLGDYECHNVSLNKTWMNAYEKLLDDRVASD